MKDKLVKILSKHLYQIDLDRMPSHVNVESFITADEAYDQDGDFRLIVDKLVLEILNIAIEEFQ